jgi:predicted ATPase
VNALSYLSWSLWCLGYPEQAKQKSREALVLAERLERPLNQAMAIIIACGLGKLRREEFIALQHAEHAVALSTEQGFPLWEIYGKIVRGWALGQQGDYRQGTDIILHGLATLQGIGANLVRSWFLLMLAETYEKAGQSNEGLAAVAEALAIVDSKGEQVFAAELYRLKGTLTLEARGWRLETRSSSPQAPSLKPLAPKEVEDEVEGYFRRAIDIARQQQAKSWELRAVMSLVQLRQQQMRHHASHLAPQVSRATQHATRNTTHPTQLEEARQMLSAVYSWFTEGFDTKDLLEAKELLESLASGA